MADAVAREDSKERQQVTKSVRVEEDGREMRRCMSSSSLTPIKITICSCRSAQEAGLPVHRSTASARSLRRAWDSTKDSPSACLQDKSSLRRRASFLRPRKYFCRASNTSVSESEVSWGMPSV